MTVSVDFDLIKPEARTALRLNSPHTRREDGLSVDEIDRAASGIFLGVVLGVAMWVGFVVGILVATWAHHG